MKHTVVVPLARALFNARVVPLLVELGRRSEVAIHLVDLRPEEGTGQEELGEGIGWRAPTRATARTSVAARDAYLTSVADQLSEVLGSMRIRTAVCSGDPEVELARYLRSTSARLLVLWAEDRDAAGEAAVGSLAERLARTGDLPVFIVARNGGCARGTLVSALDGGESARTGLELALTVARAAGAEDLQVQALPVENPRRERPSSALRPIAAPARLR